MIKIDPDGLQAGAAGGGLIGGGFGGLGGFGRGGGSSSANWDGWGGSSSLGGSSTWGGSESWGGSGTGNVCRTQPDEDYCRKRKNYCITYCLYELNMPGRRDNTGPFRACIRRCMNVVGCDY